MEKSFIIVYFMKGPPLQQQLFQVILHRIYVWQAY